MRGAGRESLTPHTVSDNSISPYPSVTKHGSDELIEDHHGASYVEQLNEVYSPGQLYPAESAFDPSGY